MADDDKRRRRAQEDSQTSFLGRWARRKQESRQDDRAPQTGPGEDPPAKVNKSTEAGALEREAGGEDVDPESLPDPDSLPADADWSVFMRKGVPEALQRRALRRLWRVNPLFGHLDRLNDYDDDYTDAATVVQGLKSLYKVGKGMISDEEEQAGKAPADTQQPPGEGEFAGDAPAHREAAPEIASTDDAAQEGLQQTGEPGAKPSDRGAKASGSVHRAEAGSQEKVPESRRPDAAARRWKRFST